MAASKWVKLNVGGVCFTTTRTTLTKEPESFFTKLLSMKSDVDSEGAILIDRDPNYFAPVLNFLRHGKLVLDKHLAEEGVLEEAEFFGLGELSALVRERIARRDAPRDDQRQRDHLGRAVGRAENVERVYRVLQCHEAEVTHLMSTLSDGWKFEQLVNVRQGYDNYDNNERAEFLAIVSREYSHNNTANNDKVLNGVVNGNGARDRAELLLEKGSRM